MRVLIVALNYAPELVGCAKYTTEFAEELVNRGYHVEVLTTPPYYPQWKIFEGYSGAVWSHEERAGVKVVRTPLYVPAKPNGVKRLLHLASFGVVAIPSAIAAASRLRPDLIFTVAPTLTSTLSAIAASKISKAKTWLHIQDFEVDAAFELGLLRSNAGRRIALAVERWILGQFDRVSSIAPAMVNLLLAKGVPADRVIELRNWVDVDSFPMLPDSMTAYRDELGIAADRVVALYSGNMAAKQGIETLAEVAESLRAVDAPVTLLFCGDGPARSSLEAACAGFENVRFLPLQPLERLPELLATADIHLLPQRSEAADLVLPSKLTGMLASGRPVVAMATLGTGLADEVAGCGLVVNPDGASMVEGIVTLMKDADLRHTLGMAGRDRAKSRWRKRAIIDGFVAEAGGLFESAKATIS